MQKWQDVATIIGPPGLIPVVGVNVSVYNHGTATLATIYSDNSLTLTSNPLTTDSSGRYYFYAANGRYDLTISGAGIQTTTLTDILLTDEPSVTDYGAVVGASAAINTTAFNAALADHSVVFVPGGPEDIYDLNALTALTTSHIIYGNASLRFNTTGDCITLTQAVSQQAKHIEISGLTFDNVTNVPSSFIKNNGFLNARFQNLNFDGCAATYCIDNWKGYGATIDKCTFTDVTGSAIRLRDDGAVLTYSYVFKVRDTDITRISVDGITCEGANVLIIDGGVIESCGGKGLVTATAGGVIQAWNITCLGVDFESNTGNDIDLGTDGSNYWSHATLIGCTFVGTPTIALGAKSKIAIIGCHNTGGNACTVSGSGSAQAVLENSFNFTQSGTFLWFDTSTSGATSYTPVWQSTGTAPALVDGTITGTYTRVSDIVHLRIKVTFGASSTYGTGTYRFSLPITAGASVSMGTAHYLDVGTNDYFGPAYISATGTQIVLFNSATPAALVSSTVPFTFSTSDSIEVAITYRV